MLPFGSFSGKRMAVCVGILMARGQTPIRQNAAGRRCRSVRTEREKTPDRQNFRRRTLSDRNSHCCCPFPDRQSRQRLHVGREVHADMTADTAATAGYKDGHLRIPFRLSVFYLRSRCRFQPKEYRVKNIGRSDTASNNIRGSALSGQPVETDRPKSARFQIALEAEHPLPS